MARVLLYEVKNAAKLKKIRLILLKLGIPLRVVAEEEYGLSLAALLGLEDAGEREENASVEAEMLVMHALSRVQFNALLDALRRERISIPLKAVVTETNQSWSSARLCRELSAEHAALERLKRGDSPRGIHQ